MNALRLVLAHELALPRAAYRLLLQSEAGITVVAEADSADHLREQVRAHHPDLVVMAVSQRAGFGSSLLESLRRQDEKTKVIALSAHRDLPFVHMLMAAGAAGYVCEQSSISELRNALHEVAQGHTYLDATIREAVEPAALAKMKSAVSGQRPKTFLSKRETEVLRMLAQGFTNQQVADALKLSVKTAETYRVRLTRKLGVKTRAELFRYAFEVGMVGPDQLMDT